ncbi:hypothetical protein N7478_005845 [Penicillium angulare]|uniref:uncharacterized protein n=1 Tax=Penicillium angulare TaxID=116970 RepID=UPI00253FFF9F|nr:uncharacterized protein N7478_005845 [Penicillium angulare]KAJ5280473.1 hypothetical protein N7478_005845 [Penicillium angulare]
MQATRAITRSLPPSLNRGRKQLRVVNSTPLPSSYATHNPPTDSDQLAYRLCELSLQKIQKEARACEPDIRHVLACTSMQRLAQQDLLYRLDTLQTAMYVPALPLLPGADEPLFEEEDEMDMKSLQIAVSELETASRRGELARFICFQQIKEMEDAHL